MTVLVDGAGIGEARDRLLASIDLLERTVGPAASALQVVGLVADAATVAAFLRRAVDVTLRLAADHAARCVLAAELEGAVLGVISARCGEPVPTVHDVRVAAAELHVAALVAAPPFPGRAAELAAAREDLVAERLARLAYLVSQLEKTPSDPGLAAQVNRRAVELGLSPQRLSLVAAALRAGASPEAARLPAWLFPRSYVEAQRASEQRRAERYRFETAMWRSAQAAAEAAIQGDAAAERVAWEEYQRWAERREMAPPVSLPSPLGLPEAVDFLASTPYLSAQERRLAIAAFLAGEIAADTSVTVVEDIGKLIGRYLTTPAAAAAFFNNLDPRLLAIFPFVGLSDARLGRLIKPYARLLSLATQSPNLRISGLDLVGDWLQPNSASWLAAGDYETSFLVSLAVAIIAASATNPYLPWIAGWSAGTDPGSSDPRVVAAGQIVARGPDAAVSFLSELARLGLIGGFVAPATGYIDGGVAAGSVLALVGAGVEPEADRLVAEVVATIAATSLQPGLREGAAAMIVPHLTSLVDPRLAYDLERTGAAEALAGVAGSVPGFLREILSESAAATLVLTALTLLLFGGIDRSFEPDDPESVAQTMRGFGHLADLVTDAYLSAGVATARDRDTANARLATLVGFAADLAVAGGLIALGPATAAAVIASEVTAAGVTGVALPALLEAAFPTDATEEALAAGYRLENDIVRDAELYLLARLHAAGQVELPADWFVHGRLVVAESDLREFEASVAGDFPYAEWINDAVSIGGAISWQPADSP